MLPTEKECRRIAERALGFAPTPEASVVLGFTAGSNTRFANNEISTSGASEGITVVASASILQGRLAQELPEPVLSSLPGLSTDAQRAIQFSRSAPGITVSLVGMSRPEHVEQNLGVASVPPLTPDEYVARFRTGS